MANTDKPPIYLLDSMAFIFRAYHAMRRQRPMSTRTGIPTAATYVFVNMINKLRKDFQPQFLAAVYDLSGPVFRDERAREMKPLRKFNVKTQQFEEVDYAGYKANREEMPADLAQQLPYIQRALEAFRIPILSYEGFEADDVIGTLSCRLAEQGYKVFVVSSDKDMMQLVNASVSILNPVKDNLVLDSKGVEGVLGVLPERVIDVMALRGDSVDNIPGAPGIGEKGSVELIQQFGSLEAALDRCRKGRYPALSAPAVAWAASRSDLAAAPPCAQTGSQMPCHAVASAWCPGMRCSLSAPGPVASSGSCWCPPATPGSAAGSYPGQSSG